MRALKGGQTLAKTLQLTREFRKDDNETPIIMMGYYNPIYIYGVDRFITDAIDAGIDGLIVVDLPPEMDAAWPIAVRPSSMPSTPMWRPFHGG